MPRSASVDDIKAIYMKAWELGLKSIAIYRDGSKDDQVLESHFEYSVCGTTTGCD